MSRDYQLVCISCTQKSEKKMDGMTMEQFAEMVRKEAENSDDGIFLEPNCDVPIEEMTPLNLKEIEAWLKRHKKHGNIAFEVIP